MLDLVFRFPETNPERYILSKFEIDFNDRDQLKVLRRFFLLNSYSACVIDKTLDNPCKHGIESYGKNYRISDLNRNNLRIIYDKKVSDFLRGNEFKMSDI